MPTWLQRLSGDDTGLPADERRRRRLEIGLIFGAILVFAIFAALETWMPEYGEITTLPGNLLFFLLINLNLILLILTVFLVLRNFTKLALERRHGILGARLRTRLVLAFVGLTLIPTTLLFFVAQGFLARAFESWFSVRVENALQGALEVAQITYQQSGDNALHFAKEIGGQVSERNLWAPKRRAELQTFLERKTREYGLAAVEAISPTGVSLATGEDPDLGRRLGTRERGALTPLLNGEEMTETQAGPRGDLVRGGVPVLNADGETVGLIVVDYLIGRSVSLPAREIAQSYQEFRQFGVLRQPMKNSYVLSMALITLVVVFSATWFGFRIAKGITVPLQRLAEGTRAVAQGKWGHQIEAGGDDELATVVTSFNQMTRELQRINSQLEERRSYIETVLANVTAGVVSIGTSGEITTVNPAAEEMLGLAGASATGRQWSEVFGRADLREVAEMIATVASGESAEVQHQVKLSRGRRVVTALITAAVLRDEAGQSLGTMVFFDDVSHMLRVERMEAWREVARRIAHEIKNPLTPIQLSAQRLRRRYASTLGGPDGAVFDECTRTIVRQVDGLKRLVNEFSSFARLPPADMAPHDLNAVIEEALVLYREGHPEIDFKLSLQAELPQIEIDREAVKRVLINLLDNAVAACQGAANGEPASIEVSTSYRERLGIVQLDVADTGCGIDATVRGRVFEPYVSTKKDGTGLGLAIVSAIAADHQAYVRVRDNQPRGTRFIIEFPLRRREHAAHAVRA